MKIARWIHRTGFVKYANQQYRVSKRTLRDLVNLNVRLKEKNIKTNSFSMSAPFHFISHFPTVHSQWKTYKNDIEAYKETNKVCHL